MKALLLYGDGTQTLPIARSLKELGYEVSAIFKKKFSYGYSSKYIKNKFIFKNTEDVDLLFTYVEKLLKKTSFDIILPMHDPSAEMLSKYRDELQPLVHFKVPDYNTFETGFDKHRLMQICEERGYPHPETIVVENDSLMDLNLEHIHFPILIKPNHTWGARGMTLCSTREELADLFPKVVKEFGECHLQHYVRPGGNQVEVQIFLNEKGDLIQSSVIKKFRWYPENGGSSCCNVSCENKSIVNICYSICKDLGWIGFADFDTIEDPDTGELLILELNPRVPACVKSCFVSGINWGDVISNEYLGLPHKTYDMHREVYLRHLGFEILWFLYSKSRFRTKPNWFKFFGRKVFYQDISSISDPIPFFSGTLGNLIKQLSPSFRKSKSGARF